MLSDDERALWGVTDDDETGKPMPDVLPVGDVMLVRPEGMPRGKAMRLPLRFTPAFIEAAADAVGTSALAQLGHVISERGSRVEKDAWTGLDLLERVFVADRWSKAMESLAERTLGKSLP